MEIEKKIEAVLFWKAEPVSKKKLSEILKINSEELGEGLKKITENLSSRGIVLIDDGSHISLGTAPEFSKLIEDLQKEELNRDLSKASLETLSIVLYKNGATRSEIDYIRGVNSSFTLRALSVRGLVQKTTDDKDSRRFIYKPTLELLSFMGLSSIDQLPEYTETNLSINGAVKDMEEKNVIE